MMEDSSLWQTSSSIARETFRFMAPELLEGIQSTVTVQSDTYAFGMACLVSNLLLWMDDCLSRSVKEVVTDDWPFSHYPIDGAVYVAVTIRKEKPARPADKYIPDELWDLLYSCWEFDSQDRVSDITIVNALIRMVSAKTGKPVLLY